MVQRTAHKPLPIICSVIFVWYFHSPEVWEVLLDGVFEPLGLPQRENCAPASSATFR